MSRSQEFANQVQQYYGYVFGVTNLYGKGPDFPRDKVTKLPVVFKTQTIKTKSIHLSDARLFLELLGREPFLLVDAVYRQEGDFKVFQYTDQYVVEPSHGDFLRGGLTVADVVETQRLIKDRSVFAQGDHKRASQHVQTWRKRFDGVLRVEPKLDSGTQRRLQIAIRDAALIQTESFQFERFVGEYRGLAPLTIKSTPRERNTGDISKINMRDEHVNTGSVLYN